MSRLHNVPFENYLIRGNGTEAFLRFYCKKSYLHRLYRRHFLSYLLHRTGVMSSQRFFTILLKDMITGMSKHRLERIAKEFANTYLDRILVMPNLNAMLHLKRDGQDILVKSEGLEIWVKPWCEKFGICYVEACTLEVDDKEHLTGEIIPAKE